MMKILEKIWVKKVGSGLLKLILPKLLLKNILFQKDFGVSAEDTETTEN